MRMATRPGCWFGRRMEEMNEELFSFEEIIHFTTMKTIKKESLQDMYWLNNYSNLQKLCKCGVTKKISSLMESKFNLEKILICLLLKMTF